MTKVNEIILCKDQFGDALWEVVGRQLEILTKAGEVCVVYDDDTDIIVIQHSHRDTWMESWGTPQPVWLDEKEQEIIDNYRSEGSSDD